MTEGQPFLPNGYVPEGRAQWPCAAHRHLASRNLKQFDSHLPEQGTQQKLKGAAGGECGDENRHNRNLIAISKFH